MNIKNMLLSALLAVGVSGAAQAALINFEDAGVPGQSSASATWDGAVYGFNSNGFHFSNADAIDLVGGPTWWASGVGGAHSGNYSGFNDWTGNITMTQVGGGAFSIQDFWTAGWQGAGDTLTITGILNGQAVASSTFSYSNVWQDVMLNFGQVDSVVFSGGLFFLEDITVNGGSVPEPASLALLGTALFGLASARRAKKSA